MNVSVLSPPNVGPSLCGLRSPASGRRRVV